MVKEKYLVYIVGDDFPIFIWATETDDNENFHRFIYNGNYICSFPRHLVREIKKDGE